MIRAFLAGFAIALAWAVLRRVQGQAQPARPFDYRDRSGWVTVSDPPPYRRTGTVTRNDTTGTYTFRVQ